MEKRPFFLTMLCSFYFIFWSISLLALIVALLVRIGSNFPAARDIFNQLNLIFLGAQANISYVTWIIAAGLVAGVIGYWLYQKWAVIVYAAASIALFIVVLPPVNGASKFVYSELIFYTIVSIFALNITMIVLGIKNFKKMK